MRPSASSSPFRRRRARPALRIVAVAVAVWPLWLAPRVLAEEPAAPTAETMSPGPHKPVQAGPELKEVLSGILCRCGCNLSVYECEATMTCEVAGNMRADAEELLAAGKTPDQVLAVFAADYGEQVLAAPTKEGFNLTAWVLPFAALGGGLVLVVFALRAWRPRRDTVAAPVAEGPEPDARYVAAVEDEVEREV